MAGFGKSSRVGKRHGPPSSMSSFSYYATIVLFVGLCIVGVWMFTSSNVTPPQVTTFSRVSSSSSSSPHFKPGFSRIVAFRHPPPDPEEDSQSTLPEEGVQGDGDDEDDKSRQKIPCFIRPKRPDRESEDGENENRSGGGEESTSNEKSQEKKEDDEGTTTAGGDLNGGTEEGKRLSEEEIHEQHQRGHDEQLPGGESENQQEPKQQPSEQIGCDNQEERVPDEQQPPPEQIDGDKQQIPDEQQPPPEQISGDNQQEQIPDEQPPPPEQIGGDKRHEQTPDEQQRQLDEQLQAGKGEDSQQEPRPQEQPQQGRGDGREEQIPEEPQKQHDEQFPVGNGEDNLQEPQQPLLAGDDGEGTQQESQPEVVEENIQQVTDEDQQQTDSGEQPVDVGGGSDDQQQPASERLMEGNSTDSREENFEQQIEEKLDDPNGGESQGGNGKTAWATQAAHSDNEKERRKEEDLQSAGNGGVPEGAAGSSSEVEWKLCNDTTGPDYIPCLDNEKAIKKLRSFRHYQHRERHCPEESPTCLVPLPVGYRRSIEWPQSRDRIWYNNVPRTKLAEVKGHQNWVKVAGEYLTFPGGGTQFIHGALHYIDFIQKSIRDIIWGKRTRVILDVGCGVASFGGYLFERDVLAMSFAPKDEHEAQVQFALERGIPAISAVMGSQRLPFPSNVFDVVHCARCRVPWHVEGGTLLLEVNRVLRPGGYFVWSATPVYQKLPEDVEIWKAMRSLTASMCWELVTIKKDRLNSVRNAFFRKPTSNECYDNRKHHSPPMCKEDDDPNAAWYIPLKTCMHRVPVDRSVQGSQWPKEWPERLQVPPYWLNRSQMGVYGRPAPNDFTADYEYWKRVVSKSYLTGLGINWGKVRNVMDMRAVYGGFAAALKDLKVWVMNIVNIDDPDTLPIIYERGLFGIYHDWCETFSTYPRSYDLLHADRLFSRIKKRCKIVPLVAEVDRIVRPGGKVIIRDDSVTISEVEGLLKSLHWEVRLTFSKDHEGMIFAEKTDWRPEIEESVDSA